MAKDHRIHRLLVIDAFIKDPPKDEEATKKLLTDIISSIGMNVAELTNNQTNPIGWYCEDKDNEGMTATAILTTSHIALHVWDRQDVAELHFDLYSCSDFESQAVVERLHQEFTILDGSGLERDRTTFGTLEFDIDADDKGGIRLYPMN